MVDSGNMRAGARHGERRNRKVIVPELTGMRLRDAQIVIAQAGFAAGDGKPNVQVRYVEAYAEEFHVVAQIPSRGQLVDSAAPIELQVARKSWNRYLPQLYSMANEENALLQQFLWMFQQIHDKTADTIERVPMLLRPLETDAQYLPWLGSWLALHLETDWTETQKRQWLRVAPALYSQRGTRQSLATLLRMYLGFEADIRENVWPFEPFRVGVASEIGVSSTILPPLNLAHSFVVHLPVPDTHFTNEQIVRIHRVILAEKPAHTMYYLTFAQAEDVDDASPFLTIGDDALDSAAALSADS